jgi:hypothetical protein
LVLILVQLFIIFFISNYLILLWVIFWIELNLFFKHFLIKFIFSRFLNIFFWKVYFIRLSKTSRCEFAEKAGGYQRAALSPTSWNLGQCKNKMDLKWNIIKIIKKKIFLIKNDKNNKPMNLIIIFILLLFLWLLF